MTSIIQVAIGMIFVFSLLSILASQINTLILNFLNLRAKQLKEGLLTIVQDKELQAKILTHPLIRIVDTQVRMAEPLTSEQADDIIQTDPTQVSYIPPKTFVEALIGLLTAQADTTIFKPLDDALTVLPNNDMKVKLREMVRDLRSFGDTDTNKLRAAILELTNETHKQVLSYALENVEDSLGRLPVKSGQLIPLLEGVNRIQDPIFKDAIAAVLVTAQNLNEARAKLEFWFNDGMDRISELYKRKIQIISLVVGLLLALVLNVDSIQLLKSFWEDPALRQSVAETAKNSIPALQDQINQANQAQENAQNQAPGTGTTAAVDQAAADAQKTLQQLLDLQLPIGWEYTPITDDLVTTSQAAGLTDPRENLRNLWNLLPSNPAWLGNLVKKIIGLVVTMIAVAQGAPFWFDLLRRITGGGSNSQTAPNVNVTVNPPGYQG